jgi:DnaJ-class molecular chaperone
MTEVVIRLPVSAPSATFLKPSLVKAKQQRGPRSRKERGQDALIRVEVELADVLFGITKTIELETAVCVRRVRGRAALPGLNRKCVTFAGEPVKSSALCAACWAT